MKNKLHNLSEKQFLEMLRKLNEEQVDIIYKLAKELNENNKKAGE